MRGDFSHDIPNQASMREGTGLAVTGSFLLRAFVKNILELSPSGDRLWTGKEVVETREGRTLCKIERRGAGDRFFPSVWLDETRLAEAIEVAGTEHTACILNVWDTDTGNLLRTLPMPEGLTLKALAASRDGHRLAEGGSDLKIRIRDTATMQVLQEFRAHDQDVTTLAWDPTTACTVPQIAACDFGMSAVRPPLARVPLSNSHVPKTLAFSPSGRRLLSRARARVRTIDPRDSRLFPKEGSAYWAFEVGGNGHRRRWPSAWSRARRFS
jgi:hypothetical protein